MVIVFFVKIQGLSEKCDKIFRFMDILKKYLFSLVNNIKKKIGVILAFQ